MLQKFYDYVNEFQEGNEYGLYFLDNIDFKKSKIEVKESDIEHILDFLYSNKKKYKNLNYSTILEKANSWSHKLQKNAKKSNKESPGDTELVKKLSNGFTVVKLITKESYEREGKLMSHCVGSYYGRGVTIYSLRDKDNFPHCTIEEGNQLKGKGNSEVAEKYIDLVIEFLESTGCNVSDRDMQNLGYIVKPKWLNIEGITTYKDKFIKKNIFI